MKQIDKYRFLYSDTEIKKPIIKQLAMLDTVTKVIYYKENVSRELLADLPKLVRFMKGK